MKNGNILRKLKWLFPSFDFLACLRAKNKVIGIIARVRVSFTVTALSRVSTPRWFIASQVDAAAVTDEVSFTAVPANTPNGVPEVVEKPKKVPRVGKISAANMLKKNITEIAWATSSWSASITGAVAAIADPPHIDDPTPTRTEILWSICRALHNT